MQVKSSDISRPIEYDADCGDERVLEGLVQREGRGGESRSIFAR